jgi:hypothetical protein
MPSTPAPLPLSAACASRASSTTGARRLISSSTDSQKSSSSCRSSGASFSSAWTFCSGVMLEMSRSTRSTAISSPAASRSKSISSSSASTRATSSASVCGPGILRRRRRRRGRHRRCRRRRRCAKSAADSPRALRASSRLTFGLLLERVRLVRRRVLLVAIVGAVVRVLAAAPLVRHRLGGARGAGLLSLLLRVVLGQSIFVVVVVIAVVKLIVVHEVVVVVVVVLLVVVGYRVRPEAE